MKTALCLFGIVGGTSGKDGKGESIDPGIAFGYYLRNILAGNDVDVFFHTWSVEHKDKLVELYNPVKYIAEKQIQFNHNPYTHQAHSRWYSTQKSINLVWEHGFEKYKMIMLSRFDVAFFNRVDFSEYNPEYFYASHWNDVGNRMNHQMGFLDLWFFGGTGIMAGFGQLYNRIDKYDISPHKAAKQHAEFIGAKVKYTMYRGEDFEMVRRAILKCKE